MPLPLLIALFLAFGLDAGTAPAPIHGWEVARGFAWLAGGIASVGLSSLLLARWTLGRIAARGYASQGVRRTYFLGLRAIEVLILVAFGLIVHVGNWPRVVRSGLRLGDVPFVDDVAIILPFLLAQLASWWGLFRAERAIRPAVGSRHAAGLGRHLTLKARQTLGLLLPVLIVFSLGQDVFRKVLPQSAAGGWAEPIGMAAMGIVVLVGSPLFVRLAWPTYPLPQGPLRDRLEHLAHRFGFRCTDILVQETGGGVVNAGVTGTLPWFRYVFLTDALIENLEPNQVAAVFGHEIGHLAHRHLLYFGFFFMGSMAVLALLLSGVRQVLVLGLPMVALAPDSTGASLVEAAVFMLCFGLYFLVVFGHVSRRFERQADVFGCRAVSCGRVDCPPHADLNGPTEAQGPPKLSLCPVGIRVFISALADVAALNGTAQGMRSWRHGSVERRIAFLEGLEGKPEAERRFQAGINRLRLGMAAVLVAALLYAFATDQINALP